MDREHKMLHLHALLPPKALNAQHFATSMSCCQSGTETKENDFSRDRMSPVRKHLCDFPLRVLQAARG
jgi:hypothetical protein